MRRRTARTRRARAAPGGHRAQATVEYLLMLSAVVTEVLLFYQFMSSFMPRIFNNIQSMVAGTTPWP